MINAKCKMQNAKCLTAIDTDTGVVAGRYVQCTRGVYFASRRKTPRRVLQKLIASSFLGSSVLTTWLLVKTVEHLCW